MKIDDVIDTLVEKLSGEESLESVLVWHKINGILPEICTSGSVGCDKLTYADYDNSVDEVTADITIFLYTQEADPALGEKTVRGLADEARYVLTIERTLGGKIALGTIEEIEYVYADAGESLVLHAAAIRYRATYYQERHRAKAIDDIAPVEQINNTIERSEN